MKISKERLKQIIQEEIEAEIEEGLLGNLALGLATAMHGGAKPIPTSADIPSLDTGEPEAAQVMQAPKEGLSDDGESFTASFKIGDDIQLAFQQADMAAKAGLQKVKPGKEVEISSRINIGGKMFSTATVK